MTYGDICAHDYNYDNDNNDMTDYFTPCTCTRGNNHAYEINKVINYLARRSGNDCGADAIILKSENVFLMLHAMNLILPV